MWVEYDQVGIVPSGAEMWVEYNEVGIVPSDDCRWGHTLPRCVGWSTTRYRRSSVSPPEQQVGCDSEEEVNGLNPPYESTEPTTNVRCADAVVVRWICTDLLQQHCSAKITNRMSSSSCRFIRFVFAGCSVVAVRTSVLHDAPHCRHSTVVLLTYFFLDRSCRYRTWRRKCSQAQGEDEAKQAKTTV